MNSDLLLNISISAGHSSEADVQLPSTLRRGARGDGRGPGHVRRRLHHGVQRGRVQAQSGEFKEYAFEKVGGDVDVNCDNGWAGVNIIGVMRNVRQGTSIAQARHGLRARERGIEAGPVHYYNFTTIPHQDLIPFPNLRVF